MAGRWLGEGCEKTGRRQVNGLRIGGWTEGRRLIGRGGQSEQDKKRQRARKRKTGTVVEKTWEARKGGKRRET